MAAIGRGLSCVLSVTLPLIGLAACGGGGGGDGGVGGPTIASADPPGGTNGGTGGNNGGGGGGGTTTTTGGGGGTNTQSGSTSGSQSSTDTQSTSGSGGTGGSSSSSSSAALGGGTLTALRGKGLESGSPDPTNGAWRVDGSNSPNATLTIAADGNSRSLGLPDGSSAVLTGGTANGDGSRPFTGPVSGQSGTSVTMVSWGGAGNLHYTDYGTWEASQGGAPSQFAVYAVGLPTAAGQMPTTGTATYTGGTSGFASVAGTGYAFKGDATVNADFGHGSVSGRMSNLQATALNGGGGGGMNDINLSGSIVGNGISGTATPGTSKTIDIGKTSGNFGGTFNGPTAQEVAGSYKMTGGGDTVLGSFGAHQ